MPARLSLIFLLTIPIEMRASHKIVNSVGPVIVSISHPHDSRGEIVYENQGAEQKDQPVVTGTFIQPLPIELPQPKYPKSHKKNEITVEGVIAQNGEFIDAKVVKGVDPEFSQSALDAVARYRFKPATLDGKPVAIYLACYQVSRLVSRQIPISVFVSVKRQSLFQGGRG